MATKQYKEYGEEPCSVADERDGLNANWNQHSFDGLRDLL